MGRKGTFYFLIAILPAGLLLFVALLPDDSGNTRAEPLRVLTQNLDRMFDDIDDGKREKVLSGDRFRQRVKTAATKFGEYYDLPHIIALQEVENFNVLSQIAAEIRERYQSRYRPLLLAGNDPSGINLGYLVRYDVEIRQIDQLFRDEVFGVDAHPLFSRPPLYLEACYIEKCLKLLNLHLRSMRGIDSASHGERVRQKRLAQAETIARWSDRLQHSGAGVSLLILGDFNALTPGDDNVDVTGVMRGAPDNENKRLRGPDLVQPDLVDLTRLIPERKRYSYVYRRRKQQLDYMYVNQSFDAEVEHIAYGRIDYRLSDHAGLLARFSW